MLGVGCWLLAFGFWVLVVGCWLLVVGCWLLVVGFKVPKYSNKLHFFPSAAINWQYFCLD
jgi:hypothetical protein